MVDFWVSALIYTALEISFWYFKWFRTLTKESLPIVTSLLLAVFYTHAVMAINFSIRFIWDIDMLTKPIFPFMMWVGAMLHMIPIWKQKIHNTATAKFFFVRMILFSIPFSYLFKGVI